LKERHSFVHNSYAGLINISQGWRTFLRARAQLPINFEEILSRARGNFDEQNMVLELNP